MLQNASGSILILATRGRETILASLGGGSFSSHYHSCKTTGTLVLALRSRCRQHHFLTHMLVSKALFGHRHRLAHTTRQPLYSSCTYSSDISIISTAYILFRRPEKCGWSYLSPEKLSCHTTMPDHLVGHPSLQKTRDNLAKWGKYCRTQFIDWTAEAREEFEADINRTKPWNTSL